VERFAPERFSFDQHNSKMVIDTLRRRFDNTTRGRRIHFPTAHASHGANWEHADTFKTALSNGQIHCPPHELAENELRYLRRYSGNRVAAPTTGPVTTDDVADCLIELTQQLLYRSRPTDHLADTRLRFANQGLRGLHGRTWAEGNLHPNRSERIRDPARGRGPLQ